MGCLPLLVAFSCRDRAAFRCAQTLSDHGSTTDCLDASRSSMPLSVCNSIHVNVARPKRFMAFAAVM